MEFPIINFKFFSKSFVAILFCGLAFSPSVFSQNEKYISEGLKVQNYADAPLEINILSIFTKPVESDRFIETCFFYSVENKTKETFDNYHYEIVDGKGMASPSGGIFVVLKPFKTLKPTDPMCFSNDINEDEGAFTFRLIFIEGKNKTIWESEDHKKAVENFFEVFKENGN